MERGLDEGAALWSVVLGSVGSAAGRLLMPLLSDRIGRRPADLILFGVSLGLSAAFLFALSGAGGGAAFPLHRPVRPAPCRGELRLSGAGTERGQPCLPLCGEPLGSCHRAALAGHGRRGGGLCVYLGAPACQGPTAAQKKLNRTAQDIPFDKYERNVTNWAAKAVKVLVSSK